MSGLEKRYSELLQEYRDKFGDVFPNAELGSMSIANQISLIEKCIADGTELEPLPEGAVS